MKFSVNWDPKAEKQLEKLPSPVRRRVILKIRLTGETGRFIETLKDHEYGHKIRIGNYRVLVDVFYNPDKIKVRAIGHRKNIYKKA
tara:strand:+ start:5669 stop:5926 length:258 start_codon:yes stop_codon:yes gene_type:complete